jgi:tRNA G18 (ribose-2'-O)-methylase SpoU
LNANRFTTISDRGDPRIAPFVSVRERDLTGGTDGRFIVEGKVPLEILLTRSRFDVDSLFLCESRLEPLGDLLSQCPPDMPVYVAPQSLMDAIVGFPIHRGVLACAKKGTSLSLDAFHDAKRLLVLNQISNHDNVGAAFRNAAAFGAEGVILDAGSCDPLYRKAIRVSSGASLWLPYHQGGIGLDQVHTLQAEGFEVWAMTPREGAAPLRSLKVPDKLAILLGAEGPGLPDPLIEACQAVRIPMKPGFDSLNVATAGAIALAHTYSAD